MGSEQGMFGKIPSSDDKRRAAHGLGQGGYYIPKLRRRLLLEEAPA